MSLSKIAFVTVVASILTSAAYADSSPPPSLLRWVPKPDTVGCTECSRQKSA